MFYNPETRRLTHTGNMIAALAAVGGLATLTGCADGTGVETSDSGRAPTTATAPSAEKSSESDMTNAPTEKSPGQKLTKLAWPGKVALSEECPQWSTSNPGNISVKNGEVIVVADARSSYPAQCDPELDKGAGAQRGASTESGAVSMPNTGRYNYGKYFKDGTTLKVSGYAEGQLACEPSVENSSTSLWLQVQAAPGDPRAWVSAPNAGFPNEQMLVDAGIPDLGVGQSQYASTIQDGC